MGHQFGANHTFAGTRGSCRGTATARPRWSPGRDRRSWPTPGSARTTTCSRTATTLPRRQFRRDRGRTPPRPDRPGTSARRPAGEHGADRERRRGGAVHDPRPHPVHPHGRGGAMPTATPSPTCGRSTTRASSRRSTAPTGRRRRSSAPRPDVESVADVPADQQHPRQHDEREHRNVSGSPRRCDVLVRVPPDGRAIDQVPRHGARQPRRRRRREQRRHHRDRVGDPRSGSHRPTRPRPSPEARRRRSHGTSPGRARRRSTPLR